MQAYGYQNDLDDDVKYLAHQLQEVFPRPNQYLGSARYILPINNQKRQDQSAQ